MPEGSAPTAPDPTLMLEVARERLQVRLETVDAVDTKFGVVMAAGTAVAALVATVIALRPAEWEHGEGQLIWAAGVLYLGLVVITVLATLPRTWDASPDADKLLEEVCAWTDPLELQWKAIGTYLCSAKTNSEALHVKVRLLRAAFAVLSAETVVFGVSVWLAR